MANVPRNVAKNRKDALRESDASVSEDSENDSEKAAGGRGKPKSKGWWAELQRSFQGFGNVGKALFDYGPPYTEDPKRESLTSVCYDLPNVVRVHTLLNERANPNIQDPDDFYFTAMHYCARNGDYLILRMLRRAGGDLNLLNEFGQTPLMMCCMQISTPDKVRTQHKMFLWLLREGVDIHHRDRSGMEALDYCAMNNDFEKVKELLARGAKVRRTNFLLAAQRKSPLKLTTDPDCWRVMNEALKVEEAKFQDVEAQRKEERDEEERLAGVQRNLQSLRRRKEKREEGKRKAIEYDKLVTKLERRKTNVAMAMDSLTRGKKEIAKTMGEYERDEVGNWTWVAKDRRDSAEVATRRMYEASAVLMHKMRDKNRLALYQERWKKMGGEGLIELDWKRSAPFLTEGEEEDEGGDGDEDDEDEEDEEDNNEEDKQADADLGLEEGDDLSDLLGALGK